MTSNLERVSGLGALTRWNVGSLGCAMDSEPGQQEEVQGLQAGGLHAGRHGKVAGRDGKGPPRPGQGMPDVCSVAVETCQGLCPSR